jgi:hypothetical protein
MSKSELDKAKAKIKGTISGLFVAMFMLGAAYQYIVPLFYALGAVSAVFLLRWAVSRWLRR